MSQRIFLNLVIAVSGTLAVQGAALAQHSGTMEQQMACTPDVFRLCGAQIPDENRIVACLRRNTSLLSVPCRAVFESNDSVPAPTARVQQAQPVVQQPVERRQQRSTAAEGLAEIGRVLGRDQHRRGGVSTRREIRLRTESLQPPEPSLERYILAENVHRRQCLRRQID